MPRTGVDADLDLLLGQAFLSVEAPSAKTNISRSIQVAGKLRRKENPRKLWRRESTRQHTTQHVLGTVPPILALAVREMNLAVVVPYEFAMGLLHLVQRGSFI